MKKGRSWRRSNPRDVLARLIAEHPKAGKRKILELFTDHMRWPEGTNILDHVAKYWFEANWERVKDDHPF